MPKSEAETQGGRLLLIGGGGKEFPGPNLYEMEVRNYKMVHMMGARDFLGGIYLLGNPFWGEYFYCRMSRKSLPGGKDLLGGISLLLHRHLLLEKN